MFSTAMAEKVAAKGTPRREAIAAFVGSLTTMPRGTTFPAASPMRYALKASTKPRRREPPARAPRFRPLCHQLQVYERRPAHGPAGQCKIRHKPPRHKRAPG